MKKINFSIILLVGFLITSCGYQPKLLKKNVDELWRDDSFTPQQLIRRDVQND